MSINNARKGLEDRSAARLITAEQLAIWLSVSKRSIYRLGAIGLLPAPMRLRKAVRWRVADIEAWVAAGCPARGKPIPSSDQEQQG